MSRQPKWLGLRSFRARPAHRVAGVLGLAGALFLGAAGLARASVSTDAYYYNAGDTVHITGNQMSPGENVVVDVNLPDGTLGQAHTVAADSSGDFTDSYTLPTNAEGGVYTVVATGQSSGHVFTTTFDPAVEANCMGAITPTASSPGQTSLTVNWTDNCTNEAGFTIKYGTTSGSYPSSVNSSKNTTSRTLTGLTCGTTYFFKVEAFTNPNPKLSDSLEGSGSTSACSGGGGPVADAGGPYTGNEGSAIPLDGSHSTGTGLSYAWSVADVTAGDSTGNAGGAACTFDNATSATPNLTCNDGSEGGVFVVTLTVTDAGSNTSSDNANVTVNNVNPVVAASNTWTVTPSNCSVMVTAGFKDAGLNDTHTATINWGDLTTPTAGTVTEETDPTIGGSVSGSHTYAGPGTYNITVTVTDEDTGQGSATLTGFNNNPVVGGLPVPPIMSGKTFKVGSTIPVKVIVTGCTTGLAPTISINPASSTVSSAGNSNTANILRYTSDLPGFIYNWQTKGWPTNTYTVTVSGLPGSVTVSNDVQLTK